jgi:Ca2+-binding RTX toxin-like protein
MPTTFPFTANDSTELRNAIQDAGSGDVITLVNGETYASILTLAKRSSYSSYPATPGSGYVINGEGATIEDTRIIQQNIDSNFGPGVVTGSSSTNLVMNYSTGGAADGRALLSANLADITLMNVVFQGVHRGWDNNGNKYMSVIPNYDPAIGDLGEVNVAIAIDACAFNITGQANGFNPNNPTNTGGSAFLHSWNNKGNVTLTGNTFDEAGYLASFNFLNLRSAPAVGTWGDYTITGNTFLRSTNATARSEGNRLKNVDATLTGNTFLDGAFLQVEGDLAKITFSGQNEFTTVAGSAAIYVSDTVTGNIVIAGGATTNFYGPGLALMYTSAVDGTGVTLANTGASYTAEITIIDTDGAPVVVSAGLSEIIAGGQGNDTLIADADIGGNAWITGDAGNDTIISGNAFSTDYLFGGSGNDVISAGGGNDYVEGGEGNDSIDAGAGADIVYGGNGNDTLLGDEGNDHLYGEGDDDNIFGGNGLDTIYGGDGLDTLDGGAANDSIFGGNGADLILGGDANDTLFGEAGADSLNGQVGTDRLFGGDDDDFINGGLGNDTLTGNSGDDSFVFDTTLSSTNNVDIITDFKTGGDSDKILLSRSIFTSLSLGTLSTGDFGNGFASGVDVVYFTSGGNSPGLFFRAGGGTSGYTRFATLAGTPTAVSASDFIVIA